MDRTLRGNVQTNRRKSTMNQKKEEIYTWIHSALLFSQVQQKIRKSRENERCTFFTRSILEYVSTLYDLCMFVSVCAFIILYITAKASRVGNATTPNKTQRARVCLWCLLPRIRRHKDGNLPIQVTKRLECFYIWQLTRLGWRNAGIMVQWACRSQTDLTKNRTPLKEFDSK